MTCLYVSVGCLHAIRGARGRLARQGRGTVLRQRVLYIRHFTSAGLSIYVVYRKPDELQVHADA